MCRMKVAFTLTFMKAEQLKLYISSREYIFCLLMRKCLSDKWLQTEVSQGHQYTEELQQTSEKIVLKSLSHSSFRSIMENSGCPPLRKKSTAQ